MNRRYSLWIFFSVLIVLVYCVSVFDAPFALPTADSFTSKNTRHLHARSRLFLSPPSIRTSILKAEPLTAIRRAENDSTSQLPEGTSTSTITSVFHSNNLTITATSSKTERTISRTTASTATSSYPNVTRTGREPSFTSTTLPTTTKTVFDGGSSSSSSPSFSSSTLPTTSRPATETTSPSATSPQPTTSPSFPVSVLPSSPSPVTSSSSSVSVSEESILPHDLDRDDIDQDGQEENLRRGGSSLSSSSHGQPPPSSSLSSSSVWNVSTTNNICNTCFCSMTSCPHVGDSVKTVNCSGHGLTSLFPHVLPHDVESIILSNNVIVDLYNQVPSSLDHLLSLDVSFNNIRQLGRGYVFHNMTHLRVLNLSRNSFKTLFAGVFRGLKRLETLIIRDGQLKYMDEHAFDGLENLRHLDLEGNQITSVYLELFQSILNLHVLNLGRNSISHLSGGIFASLNGLRHLNLSANRITGINNNAFVGLESLEEVNLDRNFLSRVPSIPLQSLKRLRSLSIGGNLFTSLSTGDFVHTPIQELFVDNCPNLRFVDRGSFWDLPGLREIHLHSNPRLQFIDSQAFLGVTSLNSLFLHNNSLLTIQEELILSIVHVDGPSSGINFVNEVVPGSLSGPSSLSSTTFLSQPPSYPSSSPSSSSFSSSSPSNLQSSPSTTTNSFSSRKLRVSLSGNRLLCDCNVRFLLQCLRPSPSAKIEVIDPEHLFCSSPSGLEGVKVIDLISSTHEEGAERRHHVNRTTNRQEQDKQKEKDSSLRVDKRTIKDTCPPIILPSMNLKISSLPVILESTPPPPIIRKMVGDRHTFSCRALGVPTPKIHWILPSGEVRPQPILRLFHLKPRDSGSYTCLAVNSEGNVTSSQELVVKNVEIHIWPHVSH